MQGKDQARTSWPWPYFQVYEGHLSWFKRFSLNMWRIIWCSLTKFGTQRQQGKTENKMEPHYLDLIFKMATYAKFDAHYLGKIFYLSPRNFLHRSSSSKRVQRSNFTLFSRSGKPFRMVSADIWSNIWHVLTKFGTQKQQCKTKTNLNRSTLTLFSRSRMSFV